MNIKNNLNLNPWQITGFTDAEGGFFCSISISDNFKVKIKLEFKVTQKNHSESILYQFKEFFECGNIVIDNRETNTKKYQVTSLSNIIDKIIPHFEAYPCLTSKYLNFKDWKEIALMMSNKQHLDSKGLDKIKELKAKLNKSRSFEDKYEYCKLSLGLNHNNEVTYSLPNYWVQAFIDGEGTFYNYIASQDNSVRVDSSLEIAQNSHDVAVLLAIKKFFDGGYIKPKYNFFDITDCQNSRSVNRFIFRDTDKIIKFFDQFPLLTRKCLDFEDWKKIVNLKNTGAHKTSEGLRLINEIKNRMNSKRDNNGI